MRHPRSSRRSRLALLALGALSVTAVPAAAQTIGVTLTPPYQEGVNGANGWYRVSVRATYQCLPPAPLLLSCPGGRTLSETFGHQAGTKANPLYNGQPGQPLRLVEPITRTATWQLQPAPAPPTSVTTVLISAPNVPLKVDSAAPPLPEIRVPRPAVNGVNTVYDAGSLQKAAFGCFLIGDTSGPAPVNPCLGPVVDGAVLDTGAADTPATYGNRAFTVVATDLAGNTRARTVNYTVDELPGPPTATEPLEGDVVDARPTFEWTPPADDGSGLDRWRLRVTPASGAVRTFTFTALGSPVTFQPPEDLPAGKASWNVTFVDARNRQAVSATRTMTVVPRIPAAPTIVSAPTSTTDPRPTFSWEPAEAGGTFTWEITGAQGGLAQGPGTTATTTLQTDALAPGGYAFRVRQVSALGRLGDWSAPVAFTILAPPPPAIPTPKPVVKTTTLGRPRTENARALTPRAGAAVTSGPLLRWKRTKRATLYNIQLFRYSPTRYIKVHTAFPRGTSYRVPKGKLAPGKRYVWRVWPYLGGLRKYTPRPTGVSWFDLKAPVRRR